MGRFSRDAIGVEMPQIHPNITAVEEEKSTKCNQGNDKHGAL
jgi:hypothetical protein